ncbi:hypothetical protein ECG_09073 [Echinococcus granulosus]|nr:hypothetical protein ECG_09073 [Echinococcus granulosus]
MLPAGRRQSSPESHKHMPYGRQKNLSTYEFHETDKEIFAPAQYLREHPRVVFTNCAIKERRMSAVSSFLLLFAIVEGVVSFVLPIVDAFGPPKHIQHKFYLEVFKLLQFMVSIVALTYLQAPILYYKRQFQDHEIHLRERKPLNKSDCNVTQNDHINYKREESQVDFIDVDNSADVSDSNEQNNRFKCQHNEESRCENPSNTHGVKRGFLSQKKEISEDGKRAESSEPLHDANKLELLGLLVKRRIHTIGRMFGDRTTTDRKRNPPPIECEQGNNLYLRLGAVVFGFGVMIMDGFRVADQFDSLNAALSCHSAFWIPVNVIHSIYIFWQTYFLFKHHHVVFNVKKFFVRFILAHMTVVNLGQWMGTIVQEVMISDKEEGNTSALNVSALSALIVSKNLNLTTNLYAQCKSQVGIFAHYLIPCGVEYSLIACAIFYKMFRRVGHITRSEVEPQCVISSSTADEGARSAYECLLRNNPTECQHGHKGLFAGLLLVMTTLVAMALFYTHLQRSSQVEALTLFQGTYIVLLSIGILAVSIALFQVRVLGAR